MKENILVVFFSLRILLYSLRVNVSLSTVSIMINLNL